MVPELPTSREDDDCQCCPHRAKKPKCGFDCANAVNVEAAVDGLLDGDEEITREFVGDAVEPVEDEE